MCTVTFVPLSDTDFIFTSSRDEDKNRETIFPKEYSEQGLKVFYPKDKLAGGTWFGVSENQRLLCVLNGGFEKHKRLPSYSKSRGILVKELLVVPQLELALQNILLQNIEPFTLIGLEWKTNEVSLIEFVWDGKMKHFQKLPNKPKIWSSSTLYTDEIKEKRQKWFTNLVATDKICQSTILDFHHSKYDSDENAVLMKRPNVQTVSITSVVKSKKSITMYYESIINKKVVIEEVIL